MKVVHSIREEQIQHLEYKPRLAERIQRHRQLWTGSMPDGILARMDPGGLPFRDPLKFCPNVAAMAAAWEHNYRVRQEVEDDLLPVARVSFGSQAFGGYLGAQVMFNEGAGWSQPLLNSYSNLDQLRFDPENPWILRQQEACRHFVGVARGKFALCETEPMDALNLVEVLRGAAAYTDLFDYPREMHQLLDFAVQFNIQLIELQRAILAPCLYIEEGLFSMFRIWLPGQAVWISVDAYGLCSRRVFAEFGAPYLQRVIDHFGGGWIHIHSSALHLLPEIVRLKGVLGVGVYDDPNAPHGFEHLGEICKLAGRIPLQIDCTARELESGMRNHSLPGGVMYVVKTGIESVAQANRLMEKVREYQAG